MYTDSVHAVIFFALQKYAFIYLAFIQAISFLLWVTATSSCHVFSSTLCLPSMLQLQLSCMYRDQKSNYFCFLVKKQSNFLCVFHIDSTPRVILVMLSLILFLLVMVRTPVRNFISIVCSLLFNAQLSMDITQISLQWINYTVIFAL